MSAIKRYTIGWEDHASMTVQIDHDIMNDEVLHEINNFWVGAKQRVRAEHGSVLNAVLKMLASICFSEASHASWNTEGLIALFGDEGLNDGIEGWPKMDGSAGIKIIDCDVSVFDELDMYVEEKGDAA